MCKHIWRQVETNELGQPTKYKCVSCPQERVIKKDLNLVNLFNQLNSISNRIFENHQRIEFIKLNSVGIDEKLHIRHLQQENKQLERIYKFGV